MKAPPAHILDFLNDIGARGVGHHACRSLTEHLIATWAMLEEFGADDDVMTAGLCHSVYGTDAFDTACLGPGDRPRVIEAIGETPERLAFLFGAMLRDDFLADPGAATLGSRFGAPLAIAAPERTALCDMLLANELDLVIARKGRDRPDKVVKKVAPVYRALENTLSPGARAVYLRYSSPSR